MFALYGPVGSGDTWRASRGAVAKDFGDSASAFTCAVRLAGGNRGKVRRTRYAADVVNAGTIVETPWKGMGAKALAKAIKAGDFDERLDAIEVDESRKSVLSAIAGRR